VKICSGTGGHAYGHAEIVFEETAFRHCPFCSAKDEWDEAQSEFKEKIRGLEDMLKTYAEPRKGWYTQPDWMKVFRPDGVGRIGVGVPGDMQTIEFTEIVCDVCNAECGIEREQTDGTLKRDDIYYNGWGSYCVSCGKDAERNKS
jgi:hypothetical protein